MELFPVTFAGYSCSEKFRLPLGYLNSQVQQKKKSMFNIQLSESTS